jgi:hypothetical protein
MNTRKVMHKLLTEAGQETFHQEWRRSEGGLAVTQEERATIASYLDLSIPLLEKLRRTIDFARRSGRLFTDEEFQHLAEAVRILDRAQIPMSLLKHKDPGKGLNLKGLDLG